jgi:sporulation protein YlmC with PRC-barrel domain
VALILHVHWDPAVDIEAEREHGMTTKLVKGTPVVSLADGTTLGTIEHVYFDPRRMAVVGFTFHHRNGLFGGTAGLVDIADVHAFGPDAVTVDDVSVVRSELAVEANQAELIDLEDLLERTVMTDGGALLGRVAAIQFGDASHALLGIDVASEGAVKVRRIAASQIESIGTDLIIVDDRARTQLPVNVQPLRTLRTVSSGAAAGDGRRPAAVKVASA